MNYKEEQIYKNLIESKLLVKQAVSFLERCHKDSGAEKKAELFSVLVKANRLYTELVMLDSLQSKEKP